MPRFAAKLTIMHNEHAFLERFGAAARDGFRALEFLLPYERLPLRIKVQLVAGKLPARNFPCETVVHGNKRGLLRLV
jgi:hydroxypyruvate isomerase